MKLEPFFNQLFTETVSYFLQVNILFPVNWNARRSGTSLYLARQSMLQSVLLLSSSFSMTGLLWQNEPQLAQPAIVRLLTVRKRLKHASLHILWTVPRRITSCLLCGESRKMLLHSGEPVEPGEAGSGPLNSRC